MVTDLIACLGGNERKREQARRMRSGHRTEPTSFGGRRRALRVRAQDRTSTWPTTN